MIDLLVFGTKYKTRGEYLLLVGTSKAGKTWLGLLDKIGQDFYNAISSLNISLDKLINAIANNNVNTFLKEITKIEDYFMFEYVREKYFEFIKNYKKKIKMFNKLYGANLKGEDIIEDTHLAVKENLSKEYLEIFKPFIEDLKEIVKKANMSLHRSYTIERYPIKTGKGWAILKVIPGQYTENLEKFKNSIRKYDKIIVAFGPLDFYGNDGISLDIFIRKDEYKFLELLKGKNLTAIITMADDIITDPSINSLYIWRDYIPVDFEKILKEFLRKHPIYRSILPYIQEKAREFFRDNLSLNPSKNHWNHVMYEIMSILIAITPKKIYYVSSLRRKGRENFIKAIESLL